GVGGDAGPAGATAEWALPTDGHGRSDEGEASAGARRRRRRTAATRRRALRREQEQRREDTGGRPSRVHLLKVRPGRWLRIQGFRRTLIAYERDASVWASDPQFHLPTRCRQRIVRPRRRDRRHRRASRLR